MDQERFDQLARKISSASTRRTMLGGMVAGLFGAGIAKLGDAAAKTGKTKHKKVKTHKSSDKNKKGKDGSVHKEQLILCAGFNDQVSCPNGCCQQQGIQLVCVQNGQGQCGTKGAICQTPGIGQCCDPISGSPVTPPPANPATGIPGTCGTRPAPSAQVPVTSGGLCAPCPGGCCSGPSQGAPTFGSQCRANGSGNCGLNGAVCNSGNNCSANPTIAAAECCTSTGNCAVGVINVATCGAGRNLCKVCTGTNPTCISGACQAAPTCPAPQTDCNGTCIDLANNAANCGACGKP